MSPGILPVVNGAPAAVIGIADTIHVGLPRALSRMPVMAAGL